MGLEYISQPQVFLSPITAVGGIQNGLLGDSLPPLYTSFYTWTSTSSVTASIFPLDGIETLTNRSGSYIVTVGGVVQSPTNYVINPVGRTLTFDFTVNPNTEVVVTQIGTTVSLLSVASLTANNSVFQNSTFQHIGANSLLVTNLTALTAEFRTIDITQFELSGFSVLGDANIVGNSNVTGTVSSSNVTATNSTLTNLTATRILLTDTGTLLGATSATSIGIGSLSARTFALVHDPANDGVDPILDIGETLTGSFSGFRVRYEEPTNRLIGSSRTGTTILTSFMIDTATGQVGISGLPASGQALTVVGNVSASGAIRAVNTWPNRQYRILSADEAQFAAGTSTTIWSATPFILQPNLLYNTSFYIVLSSNGTTPAYAVSLSGSAPFSVLEGFVGSSSFTNEAGNPFFARDLRELNTGTPASTYAIIPQRTFTNQGPHGMSINTVILSSTTTTQIILSCLTVGAASRVKSYTYYVGNTI